MFTGSLRRPMLSALARPCRKPFAPSLRTQTTQSDDGTPPEVEAGPRKSLHIGVDSATATQNILRLLESSHGANSLSQTYDSQSPWHAKCLSWHFQGKWTPIAPKDSPKPTSLMGMPSISWVQFGDDRTAMAKVRTMDGSQRYLSLLRLHDSSPSNDGWAILREVVCPTQEEDILAIAAADEASDPAALFQCLRDYLVIEHGIGATKAEALFAPGSSLLSIGIAPPDFPPSEWSVPAGHLLEIPIETYLQAVAAQTDAMGGPSEKVEPPSNTTIVQVDFGLGTAAATVRTVDTRDSQMAIVDHLLLGFTPPKDGVEGGWKILSRTLCPTRG